MEGKGAVVTESPHASGRAWPHWPNLNQFEHQAKDLLQSFRAGNADAIAEVERYKQAANPASFALNDAQQVLARSFGFTSWQMLKNYVQTLESHRQPLEPKIEDEADRFLRLACITYFDGDHPARRQRAQQLLAEKPQIARANIYTAVAVGDVAAVADLLTKNVDVRAKGGPFAWEPLLYASYSRIDCESEGHSTYQVARLLLEHGADPNAGFLWDWGGPFPCLFTALTGVLGLGETDVHRTEGPLHQPPHPYWLEFARLLLEAGADPNDNQGLYNRMQYPSDEHLKLLFEFGLGKDQGGPWFERFFRHWPQVDNRSPADILSYQLRYAVKANYFDRVKLLVENGADVNAISPYPAGARAPYAEALYHGRVEIADYLLGKGAKRIALGTVDAFAAACNRVDSDRARELVASDPSLRDDPRELLTLAAEENRTDRLRLLVNLGFDLHGKAGCSSPLHAAALAGQLDAVQWLVEQGADVHARDANFDNTPLGFASYKDQRRVIEYLLPFATIREAVEVGGLDRVRVLLRENPECVNARDDEGCTPLHYPHQGTPHGKEMIELFLEHGADINAKNNAGRKPIDQMLQNGRPDLASVLRRRGGDSADRSV